MKSYIIIIDINPFMFVCRTVNYVRMNDTEHFPDRAPMQVISPKSVYLRRSLYQLVSSIFL